MPFVIRTEQGVIDRGIYTIWSLDPTPGNAATWDRGRLERAARVPVRRRLRHAVLAGPSFTGGADADLLGRGYAVATNTLDTLQTACNPVLSAEAALMTREHFVEQYGVPAFTIGDGGSGGAIQQFADRAQLPGISRRDRRRRCPFPDASFDRGRRDRLRPARALLRDRVRAPRSRPSRRQAINGHASTGTCEMWNRLFVGGVNPTDGCDAIGDQVYNPVTNPEGARCTLQDINVNVFGVDPDDRLRARGRSTTSGSSTASHALKAGVITVDQFLDLNEHIGGYDIDGNFVAARAAMTRGDAPTCAYRAGAVIGSGPLLDVPIILRNLYTDDIGDIHTRFHAFSIRDRLADRRDRRSEPPALDRADR